jgi:hypothetical protein
MTDDGAPWFSPGHRIASITRQRRIGEAVWRLRHPDGGRTQTCEIRDDSAMGAGFDVMVLEDGEPLLCRRCLTLEHAWYVARALEQDTRRSGWVATEAHVVTARD